MQVNIYNIKNEVIGQADVPDVLLQAPWRPALVRQVVTALQANQRLPWAHAKGRGEVRGGGRKPWRQKGTGRARHGSRRSPLWIGGGKAHGPNKERDYSQKINKQMKRQALLSVLSRKFKDQEVKLVDQIKLSAPKTKEFSAVIRPLVGVSARTKNLNTVVVPAPENKELFRAGRNIPKTKVLNAASLSILDLLNYRQVLIESGALPILTRTFAPSINH
ncbi:MAG: 50S ribosomal protein L4 [Candidatus Liptonbacteria bacterium]|nr:50S ribosomal protein L4 [Candidatus Liptonbacteria bacterium]